MGKKLITAALALVALAAFALPAAASATPVITHPTVTRLDPVTGSPKCGSTPGICIKATNTTIAKFKAGGVTMFDCSTAVMTGSLTKNTGTEIEGDITTATFSGTGPETFGMHECTSEVLGGLTDTTNGEDPVGTKIDEGTVPLGTPWCLKSVGGVTNEFTVAGGTCGSARAIDFILDFTAAGECKYQRSTLTGPIKGTFTTDTTGDALLTLVSGPNTEFKKSVGGILCFSSITLEIQFTMETDAATAEPLYIS